MTSPLPPPPQAPSDQLKKCVSRIMCTPGQSSGFLLSFDEACASVAQLIADHVAQQTEALRAENARLTEHVRLHEEAKANWLPFQQERETVIAQLRAQLQESAEREKGLRDGLEVIRKGSCCSRSRDCSREMMAHAGFTLTAHPPQTAGEKETT